MNEQEYMDNIRGLHDNEQSGNGEYQFKEDSKGWSNNFRGFVQLRAEIC